MIIYEIKNKINGKSYIGQHSSNEDFVVNDNKTIVSDSIVSSADIRFPKKTKTYDSKVIKIETTVTKMGYKQKNILDKVIEVLKKHEKQ